MRPALRALRTLMFTALFVVLSAGATSAFELRLVATTPTIDVPVGGLVSFDAYLDTQGQQGIQLLSASLSFDGTGVAYREDLSAYTPNDLFYYPGAGKGDTPYWLEPANNVINGGTAPYLWAGDSGPDQANVDFVLQPTGALIDGKGTVGTATDLYLATLTFETTAEGAFFFDWAIDKGGNVFQANGSVIDDQISMVGSTIVTVVPEPGTALLVGFGLLALGRATRRA